MGQQQVVTVQSEEAKKIKLHLVGYLLMNDSLASKTADVVYREEKSHSDHIRQWKGQSFEQSTCVTGGWAEYVDGDSGRQVDGSSTGTGGFCKKTLKVQLKLVNWLSSHYLSPFCGTKCVKPAYRVNCVAVIFRFLLEW